MKTSLLNYFFWGIFLFPLQNIYSQEKIPVSFGKMSVDDFNIKSSLVDANSSAVIIADVGNVKFEGNSKGWFTYVYKRQTRIKILDKKAFDLATIKILLYKNESSQEKVDQLDAVTYNIENGKVSETILGAKDIFDEKIDKNYSYKKFSLPAVVDGSIIEYSYTIKSDFEFNLPSWEFQSNVCPTLWSQYNVTIPNLLSYMSFFQGNHKLFINEGSEGSQNYLIKRSNEGSLLSYKEERLTITAPTVIHRWVMKDVSAFNVENYISSPLNYIDKISFQLFKTFDGESYHDVANNWGKVTDELMKREDFGLTLTEDNYWLSEILQAVVKEGEDHLQTAKRLYYYVQNNFVCTDHNNKYIKTTLQDVLKKKSGTVGDINLLLIALLKRANIETVPVLLSTTDAGRNSAEHPMMDRLNYVICLSKINGTNYYLDGTRPFLGFGKLPLDCYNGHARVISKDTTAIYFLADSIKEKNQVNVFISNTDNSNEPEGTYLNTMGFFGSLDTKNEISKIKLVAYKDRIKDLYPEDIPVNNIEVDSFLLPEEPVSIKFDFKLKSFGNTDVVYFNPMMNEALKKNPFYAAERFYPVEMPYLSEYMYTLNMEIPRGYKVDELPKSAQIRLNENEGLFEYLITNDGANIQFRCRLNLYKANFTNNDYATLRDFYGHIVKKESEQIVFKKIN